MYTRQTKNEAEKIETKSWRKKNKTEYVVREVKKHKFDIRKENSSVNSKVSALLFEDRVNFSRTKSFMRKNTRNDGACVVWCTDVKQELFGTLYQTVLGSVQTHMSEIFAFPKQIAQRK